MYTALQNTPIIVNLLTAANYTGWTINGTVATHVTCQDGKVTLLSYPVKANHNYQVSYVVLSVSSGYVQLQTPGANGAMQTTANLYVETVTPTANGFVQFYSNANCQITAFNVRDISDTIGTTIVFSATNKKWSDFRNIYIDYGWSIYTQTIMGNNGALYSSENGGGNNTNNFFGTQYQSSIKRVFAKTPISVSGFESISYQANQLLITTSDGIQTSLGQVSSLIDTDFLKAALNDGVTSVNIYTENGVYSASFLQDQNDDIINGNPLKGSWIMIELITVDGSQPLTLYSTAVITSKVPIGNR